MNLHQSVLLASVLVAGFGSMPAHAEDEPPGIQALQEFREGPQRRDPVVNRFFLKANRFEISPAIGFIPTNSYVSHVTFGAALNYHFTEQLAVHLFAAGSPSSGSGELKPLTELLLDRATDDEFRQAVDKVSLASTLGVSWSPFYGKINILGETVANFDFFVTGGLGIVLETDKWAIENLSYQPGARGPAGRFAIYDPELPGRLSARFGPSLGVGANFFLSQSVALHLDGRFFLYFDRARASGTSTFDDPPGRTTAVPMFSATAGISIFVPKMKPRLSDF